MEPTVVILTAASIPPMQNIEQVLIVGGGPAGLAAAIALRARNFPVTVIDAARPPIEKVCGEGLLPETLKSLQVIGVETDGLTGVPFHGVRYIANENQVQAEFEHGQGLGIRRAELHRSLFAAAMESGAEFLWKTHVQGLEGHGVRIAERLIPAGWIIGADGHSSRIRKWSGLETGSRSQRRFAFRQHFRVKPWTDFLEVYWGHRGQAYVTAVGPEEICVVIMSRDSHSRMHDTLNDFPELAGRLKGCTRIDTERGAISSSCVLRRVTRGNVALLGDASGTVDAITGEGLGLAFRQAHALALAIEARDLNRYESAHRQLRRKPQFMAKMLLAVDRSAFLQQRAMGLLSGRPKIFEGLLAVHAGNGSAREIAALGLKLGWNLLTA
jgi:menaquinone-9 beta-reductase